MRSDNLSKVKSKNELWNFLEKTVRVYNHPSFIPADPISVPHRFSKKQDIEIAGLFAALFSWGNRKSIIRKSNELMKLLDDSPHDFIRNHSPRDLKPLMDFKHRTFNSTDLLYFINFLSQHYLRSNSLESAFLTLPEKSGEKNHPEKIKIETGEIEQVKSALTVFYRYFFSLKNAPLRTRKHISSPEKKSTCKRLNMYLRWMVRSDNNGVDFGIWNTISPANLICPVDLHVARVARRFGLISRKQTDWETAMELTRSLRDLDPRDPVKYDFALFGLGVMEKY
jgi:uncharacterized protein (TIGR02757 family)